MAVDLQGALDAMRAFEDDPTADSLAALQAATGPVLDELRRHDDWEDWAGRNKRAILKLKQDARDAEEAANVEAAEAKNAADRKTRKEVEEGFREERRKAREEQQMRGK